MDQDNLRDHLAKLRAQLTDAHRRRIRTTSNRSAMPCRTSMHDRQTRRPPRAGGSVAARPVGKIAVQFEADHPTLAASARRLVELLGEVGI
jgi:hypothetical protein